MTSLTPSQDEWLSLTALGRFYGISAELCGRLMQTAGARQADGRPSHQALRGGLAKARANPSQPGNTLWSRSGCGALLEAIQQNVTAVSTTAEELARDLPHELVAPVNTVPRQRG